MNKIVIIIIYLSLSIMSGCFSHKSKHPDSPTFSVKKFKGLWKSKGYGYYLQINESGMKLFDYSASICLKQNMSSVEIASYLRFFTSEGNDRFTVSPHPGASHYSFQKVAQEDAVDTTSNCVTEENPDPELNYQYFTEVMNEHYAFFELYNIDWAERTVTFEKQLQPTTTDEELFSIFSRMLVGISDAHTFLEADIDGSNRLVKAGHSRVLRPALEKAFLAQSDITDPREFRMNWFNQYLHHIDKEILSGNGNMTDSNRILWGKIGNRGYINILRMNGYSDTGLIADEVEIAAQEMGTIISALKDTDSIIIDITANGGGEDEVSRAIAGYFTNELRKVYEKSPKGDVNPPQVFEIKPAEITFNGPVTLITSDHTVSAAEVFTMSMKTIPHVTHVGERTRGALSDTLDKLLPNGWRIGLSNEVYRDHQGRAYEGKGISPEKHISIFGGRNIYTSHRSALTRILSMNQDL